MNFSEAMQMLGTKLQGKYGHLGFKYKKSDKTLTRHSKNYTYMIAFSSFGGNTKDSISIEVCYIINTRPYDPYGYAKPDINTQPLFYSLRDNEIYLDTVIAAPITSRRKTNLPTHVSINRQVDKLRCNSVILMEQIRTIDKSRLMDRIGVLNDYEMQQVNQALGISVGLV